MWPLCSQQQHGPRCVLCVCICLQDYVDQLKLIIKVLGPPSEDDLSFINSSKARAYIRALPQQEVSSAEAESPASMPAACRARLCRIYTSIGRGGAAADEAVQAWGSTCLPSVHPPAAQPPRPPVLAASCAGVCVPCSACRGRRSSRTLTPRHWT